MVSGIFVPKTIRSLEHSFPGPFVPWNFRSRYPGPFLPQTIRSFVSRTVSGPLTKKNSVTNWSVMTATVHSRCTQTVDLHFIFQSRPSFFCFKTFTLRTLLSVFAFRTLTLHTQLTFYCYGCTFYFNVCNMGLRFCLYEHRLCVVIRLYFTAFYSYRWHFTSFYLGYFIFHR